MTVAPEVDREVARVFGAGIHWDDLGVVEHEFGGDGPALLFPASLKRRKASGDLDDQEVRLRVVTNRHRIIARVRARAWAIESKLDLDRDKDLVQELESFEWLAFAVRDPKPPYDQHRVDGQALFREYQLGTLSDLAARHALLVDVVDPRFGTADPDAMWGVIAQIARRGEPSPLGGMPGFEQASCITLMARAACSSAIAPSWARPLLTSGSA